MECLGNSELISNDFEAPVHNNKGEHVLHASYVPIISKHSYA